MLVEVAHSRNYLLNALDAAPDILDYLLSDINDFEADFRPDAERFTIREVVAHLADWDAIFLARMKQTCEQDAPSLVEIDPGQRALDFVYANTNLREQLQLFRERRIKMAEFARSIAAEDWQRACIHPRLGRTTLEFLVALVPLHDTYHVRQVTEWRRLYREDKR